MRILEPIQSLADSCQRGAQIVRGLQSNIRRLKTRVHVNAVISGVVIVMLNRVTHIAQHLPGAFALNIVELNLSGRRRTQQTGGHNAANGKLFPHGLDNYISNQENKIRKKYREFRANRRGNGIYWPALM